MDPEPSAASHAVPRSSAFALWVLVALAILTPWPFGSVHPLVVRTITLITLLTAGGVGAAQAFRGGIVLPAVPLWPILGFLAVGAFQLVPLPPPLHGILAPGSYEVWHPSEPAAAAVLGNGFRPISMDPDATWRSLAFATGLGTLAVLAAPAFGGPDVAFRAAVAVISGGLAVSVYGVVARALFGPLLFGRFPVPTVSPFGPFVSKNHFAGYVEMTALLALGLAFGLHDRARADASGLSWVRNASAGKVLLTYGAAAATALGVLASLSRGGLVSLLAGAAVLWGLRRVTRRRREGRAPTLRPWIALLFVGGTLLLLLPREAHERMLSLAGVTSEESGSFRLDTWRDTFQMWTASPLLGQGLGAFADAYPRYKRAHGELRVEHAESDYLEILAEGGVLGLGLAVVTLGITVATSLRCLRGSGDRLTRGLGAGALAGIATQVVHGAFDFNLHIPSNTILFAFLFAWSMAAGSTGARRLGAMHAGLVGGVLAAALAGVLFVPHAGSAPRPGDGLRVAASAQAAARALRLERLETALRLQLGEHPALAEDWLRLAWVRLARGAPSEGLALAHHATRLDPEHVALHRELDRLFQGAASALRRELRTPEVR